MAQLRRSKVGIYTIVHVFAHYATKTCHVLLLTNAGILLNHGSVNLKKLTLSCYRRDCWQATYILYCKTCRDGAGALAACRRQAYARLASSHIGLAGVLGSMRIRRKILIPTCLCRSPYARKPVQHASQTLPLFLAPASITRKLGSQQTSFLALMSSCKRS